MTVVSVVTMPEWMNEYIFFRSSSLDQTQRSLHCCDWVCNNGVTLRASLSGNFWRKDVNQCLEFVITYVSLTLAGPQGTLIIIAFSWLLRQLGTGDVAQPNQCRNNSVKTVLSYDGMTQKRSREKATARRQMASRCVCVWGRGIQHGE